MAEVRTESDERLSTFPTGGGGEEPTDERQGKHILLQGKPVHSVSRSASTKKARARQVLSALKQHRPQQKKKKKISSRTCPQVSVDNQRHHHYHQTSFRFRFQRGRSSLSSLSSCQASVGDQRPSALGKRGRSFRCLILWSFPASASARRHTWLKMLRQA